MAKVTRVTVFLTSTLMPEFVKELESLGTYHRSKRLVGLAIRGWMAERGIADASNLAAHVPASAAALVPHTPANALPAQRKSPGTASSKASREQAADALFASTNLDETFASLQQ